MRGHWEALVTNTSNAVRCLKLVCRSVFTLRHGSGTRVQNVRRIIGSDSGWVLAQTFLFVSIALVGPFDAWRRRSGSFPASVRVVGAILLIASVALARRSRADLADAFTMSPTPLEDGVFVDSGVYGVVRHPMYTSVILGMAGYAAFWRSWWVSAGLVATMAYLYIKIRLEEQRLSERFITYQSYRARVSWKLLPRIY